CFFFSSRRRHTRLQGDWSSDVCSSDLSLDEHFTTYNRFYGGQIGAGWDFHLGDVFLSVDSRVAFGRNHETEKVSGGSAIHAQERSEERRVGKECKARWSAYQ